MSEGDDEFKKCADSECHAIFSETMELVLEKQVLQPGQRAKLPPCMLLPRPVTEVTLPMSPMHI